MFRQPQSKQGGACGMVCSAIIGHVVYMHLLGIIYMSPLAFRAGWKMLLLPLVELGRFQWL